MVSRLSGMDAVSLRIESSTVPAHAVALIIIEASDQLSHQRLHELVGLSLIFPRDREASVIRSSDVRETEEVRPGVP